MKLKPIYLIEVLIYLYFEAIEKTEYGYRNNNLLYSIAMENDNLLNENMPVEKKAVSQAKLDHLARMRARKQELKKDRQQAREEPTQRKIRGKNKQPEAPPVNDLDESDESQSESEDEPEPVQVKVKKARPKAVKNKKLKARKVRYEPSESESESESESDDEPPRRRGKRESRRHVQHDDYEEEPPQQQMSERDHHMEMLRSQMFGGGFY